MIKKILLLAALVALSTVLKSQNVKVINDLRSRTTFGVEKELTKRIAIFGEVELGMEQNLQEVGKLHGEAGTSYALFDFLDVDFRYRYTKNRKNYSNEYKYTHTFALAAEADHKIDRFKLYYRIKYQNIDDEINWFSGDAKTRNVLKNRLKVSYNIWGSKLEPFISAELYASMGSGELSATKLKSIIGIEYKIEAVGDAKIYYRNDAELTPYFPYRYHTLGLAFTLKLD